MAARSPLGPKGLNDYLQSKQGQTPKESQELSDLRKAFGELPRDLPAGDISRRNIAKILLGGAGGALFVDQVLRPLFNKGADVEARAVEETSFSREFFCPLL